MASLPLPVTAFPSFPTPRSTKSQISAKIKKKPLIRCSHKKTQPLYDDGYMTAKGPKELHDAVAESLRFNAGPPRWFCPLECGAPVEGSPLLLFLPGLDGIGMGLFMHHKALGRMYEVRCMHVPFSDRTPFEGLLLFVEDALRSEHSADQNRPIYLLGHSFGGCLALSLAARNPSLDLVVVLTNPATSFVKSKLQPVLPLLRSRFGQLNKALLFLILSVDYPGKHDAEGARKLNSLQSLGDLSTNIISPLVNLSNLLGKISNGTISWKLKLLKSAAAHANSRLHAIKSEVLVLASSMDSLLPSKNEGERLAKSLLKCKVYYFENFGHNIILEDGLHLCSIIKSSGLYRQAKEHDYVKDFFSTTNTEQQEADKMLKMLYLASSPVMFSTMEDGRIVRGLSGVPDDGPVLLVGNHMLMGLDMVPLLAEFLREKMIILRGMAHPSLFEDRGASSFEGHHAFDFVRLVGAVPVTHRNFYRLLSEKEFVLLYPGGSREALHGKGEQYKLFWPAEPEFVRMAAKFGAKIVPFASVGEDDMMEMLLDSNDLLSIPWVREEVMKSNHEIKLRKDKLGSREHDLLIPFVLPKIPGRYYYLLGKPICTHDKSELLADREAATAFYLHVKSEVEAIISYLLKKRKEDAYRCIFQRILYQAIHGPLHQIPTFEP